VDLEPAEGVVLAAKRHLVDPALAAAMLRLDLGAVLSDSDVLGRLLDTFVVAQLRSELAICETRPRLYYLREEHGRHEIDIVAELGEGNLLAFRGRGRAAPDRDAARHLAWIREQLGERFVRGSCSTRGQVRTSSMTASPPCRSASSGGGWPTPEPRTHRLRGWLSATTSSSSRP
jgi:hypothetical protein